MKKYYLTKLNSDVYLVEKPFSYDEKDYMKIFAYKKSSNNIEYIGTSYSNISYYYNKDFIIFASEDDIEFVFDTNEFDFITDELLKRKAFDKMMSGSMLEMLDYERDEMQLEENDKFIKSLINKIK